MLTTRWRERQRQMLSRLFLRALHPDLTRFVVARGEPGGPDLWSAAVACSLTASGVKATIDFTTNRPIRRHTNRRKRLFIEARRGRVPRTLDAVNRERA